MCEVVSCGISHCLLGEDSLEENSREPMSEWAIAFTSIVAARDSTATWDFHSSRAWSGIGY